MKYLPDPDEFNERMKDNFTLLKKEGVISAEDLNTPQATVAMMASVAFMTYSELYEYLTEDEDETMH